MMRKIEIAIGVARVLGSLLAILAGLAMFMAGIDQVLNRHTGKLASALTVCVGLCLIFAGIQFIGATLGSRFKLPWKGMDS